MDLAGSHGSSLVLSINILWNRNLPHRSRLTTDGQVLYEGQDIKDGQNVWQSMGGQTVGSIWGHGAYIAPDWNADYLHRESLILLDLLAQKDGKHYQDLPEEERAKYEVLLRKELRTNT